MTHVVPFTRGLDKEPPTRRPSSVLVAVAGLAYVSLTVLCSVLHLVHLQPSVANDYWWPYFNTTSLQPFLADVYNTHLSQSRSEPMSLATGGAYSTKSYAQASTRVEWSASYGRQLLLDNISFAVAVAALRRDNLDRNVLMSSPYCWVDLNRSFAMALTIKRQRRCDATKRHNAALYFETLVRNCPPRSLVTSSLGKAINATMLDTLRLSTHGERWVDAMLRHTWPPVADEVQFWTNRGLTTWQTPMQNLYHDGIEDSIEIRNAFGYHQAMRIKKMAILGRGVGAWTTLSANCGIWNVLNIAVSLSASVVLHANNSFPNLGIEWDADIFTPPDTPGTALVRKYLGPFTVIDVMWVPKPPALAAFHRTFHEQLRTLRLTPSSRVVVDPVPPEWVTPGRVFFGGNPMCPFGPPKPFVQPSFGYYDDCSKTQRFTMSLTAASILFASHFEGVAPGTLDSMCALCPTLHEVCTHNIPTFQTIRDGERMAILSVASALRQQVVALNITFMQLAASDRELSPLILSQPLISPTPDEPWSVFGWAMVYEWLQGVREVLSFEGDEGSMTLMSQENAAFSMEVHPSELPQNASTLVWLVSVYVTAVTACLGTVVVAYATGSRFAFDGANLFWFNRVVGSVWIGRPILCLRGITALVVLSTSHVAFIRDGHVSSLHLHPRSVLESCVLAGEGTWIVYVVHDFCLPMMRRRGWHVPLSAAATWLAIVVVEVVDPFYMTATIHPVCTIERLGLNVRCMSGVVEVGSFRRLVLLGAIAGGIPVLAWAASLMLATRDAARPPPRPTLLNMLVPASASAYLSAADGDAVTASMSGILFLRHFAFDIKLWRVFLRNHIVAPHSTRSVPWAEPASCTSRRPRRRLDVLAVVVGFGYMAATVFGAYSYVSVTESILSNDFGWEMFNSTGHLSFIVSWFNDQLQLVPPTQSAIEFQIDVPDHGDVSTKYFTDQTPLIRKAAYPSAIQDDVNTLPSIVAGLRATDTCLLPWISTAFCFVDFARTWELATSAGQQRKCEQANGAVYLEALLRNTDWPSLVECWGGALDVAVFGHVSATTAGQTWLAAVRRTALSVQDEVAYWEARGVTRFTTQWQNYKTIGLTETVAIQDAFGRLHPITMQKRDAAFHSPSSTSFRMMWPLARLLHAVVTNSSGVAGMSLVRASASYAFANSTVEDLLVRNGTVTAPWTEGLALTRARFGPFGAIALKRIPPPPALRTAMATLKATILNVVGSNATALAQYTAIPFMTVYYPRPPAWSGLRHVGGNVMCDLGMNVAPQSSVYFLADGSCSAKGCDQVFAYKPVSTAAVLALGGRVSEAAIAAATCAHDTTNPAMCATFVATTGRFLSDALSSSQRDRVATVASDARSALQATINLVQFTQPWRAAPVELKHYPLFADPSFDLFSWLYVFEWVHGQREVVEFDGPVGALAILSSNSLNTYYQVNGQEVPRNVAFYLRSVIHYFTFVLLGVAALVCVNIIANGGHIEGRNMFEFNRVAALVWIGRPLMALRGITAVAILSTSRLVLARPGEGSFSQFRSIPPDILTTFLSSGEMGWVVYIMNDVFSVFTSDLTPYYTYKSSALTWLVVAVWTVAVPVQHVVELHRQCTIDAVDTAVSCHNGVFRVGRSDRFVGLLVVACGCCIVCYVVEYVRFRHKVKAPSRTRYSPLLHATAEHQFSRDRWEHESVYYLDRASAVLNGLLAAQTHHRTMIVLDIKTWRIFTMEHTDHAALPRSWSYAIPLDERHDECTG